MPPGAATVAGMPRVPRVVPELGSVPFRGTAATAAGLLTRHELAGPGWVRLFRDVYVAAGTPVDLPVRARAALVLLPGAVVSGRTAARVCGVDLGPDTGEPVEVTVPRGRGGCAPVGVRVRRRDLPRRAVSWWNGIRVTAPLTTACDLAGELPHAAAVEVLDRFVAAGLTGIRAIRAEAAERTGRGSARVRAAADAADGLAASPPETRVRLLLLTSGLPAPIAQHEVFDQRGRFVARVDFGWPGLRFAVEYDGAGHVHRLARDRQRLNALQAAGWRVFFVTATDLHDPQRLLLRIAAAMAQAAAV